jgi:hypothetical protein
MVIFQRLLKIIPRLNSHNPVEAVQALMAATSALRAAGLRRTAAH